MKEIIAKYLCVHVWANTSGDILESAMLLGGGVCRCMTFIFFLLSSWNQFVSLAGSALNWGTAAWLLDLHLEIWLSFLGQTQTLTLFFRRSLIVTRGLIVGFLDFV